MGIKPFSSGDSATQLQIYWGNSLFSEADRLFNAAAAQTLRGYGYSVFLPQEAAINHSATPSAVDIFVTDTAALLGCDVMVACIDQETIDSGVATEIGLAHAWGIPVIGLCTDIRQYRTGRGRMYKNLYVIGAIESCGNLVASVEALLQILPDYIPAQPNATPILEPQRQPEGEFSKNYDNFIDILEGWYSPAWTTVQEIASVIPDEVIRVLDFGCGTARVGESLIKTHSHLNYLGYDPDQSAVERAAVKCAHSERFRVTSKLDDVWKHGREKPFDIIVSTFVLHDYPDPPSILATLSNFLNENGCFVLIDLSTEDLPVLTSRLRRGLARPAIAPDPRLDSLKLRRWAEDSELVISTYRLIQRRICFELPEHVLRYLDFFGILRGMDLPLSIRPNEAASGLRDAAAALFPAQCFPFEDHRAFVSCLMKKKAVLPAG